MFSPLIQTVTLSSSANSQQTILSLLQGVTPAIGNLRTVCCYLLLQPDISGGSTVFAVGNSNVKAATVGSAGTGIGRQFQAGQLVELGPFTSNEVHLDTTYLTASVASSIVNIMVVVR